MRSYRLISSKAKSRLAMLALPAVLAIAMPSQAVSAAPAPLLNVTQEVRPTHFMPGGTGEVIVNVSNLARVATSGPVTAEVDLPAGVHATSVGEAGFAWDCGEVAGQSHLTCSVLANPEISGFPPSIAPYDRMRRLNVSVSVEAGAPEFGQSIASVFGGGAAHGDTDSIATTVSSAPAAFGVAAFSGWATEIDGNAATQAGSHPDLTTNISFNTTSQGLAPGAIPTTSGGNVREVDVNLPAGVIGNPTAVPTCDPIVLAAEGSPCPPETQVGTTLVDPGGSRRFPVYNITPPVEAPARLGFNINGVVVSIVPTVRTGGDYGLTAQVSGISESLNFRSSQLTLWGVPSDSVHDQLRGQLSSGGAPSTAPRLPFLTNPTECSGEPLTTTIRAASWLAPYPEATASFDTDFNGNPIITQGCDKLPFDPGLEVNPLSASKRGTPAGIGIDLTIPQSYDNADALATANLKKAVVTFPEGMSVNASSAQGLASCSPAQIEINGPSSANCPLASKIGTVEVGTPVLEKSLKGGIYLAAQKTNPFGTTLAAYLVAEGSGVVVKLPVKLATDPNSGRLTATIENSPQLPFETASIDLKTGPRAPLTMPSACGPATTTAVLTPWSGTPPVTVSSSFDVSGDGNGGPCAPLGFKPKLSAGATNPAAGSFSPFTLQLTRSDEELEFSSISSLDLPTGLLASLKGVPYCPDATLGSIPSAEGTGVAQIASPSCPAASQIGTVTVGAGAGPNPFYVQTGKAYLAGPYKGAPLSLAVVTPAVAGPFDLGNVVVRNALYVNPATAKIAVVSDPFPRILQGIPLDLKDIRVDVDRKDFTLNPTNCDPQTIDGTIASTTGQRAKVSDRFQVANCERLAFKPSLALKLSGPTHRSAYPALRATLTMPKGGANIQRAAVTLPKTEILEQAHIKTICTRVQYAANSCPKASVYGYAKAWSPLLDKPLQGPVYLRSSSHKLPDLVASLDGQIHIDLQGRIDSTNARIRNTFDLVPDAPVSKFVLTMQGGKKGLLVNNTELCRAKPRADALFDAQNGKVSDSQPLAKVDCGKGRKGGKK